VRARALHPDVLVVTSAVLQVNCVLVRGGPEPSQRGEGPLNVIEAPAAGERDRQMESFLIDSPVLPDELDMLPSLLEQSRFPPLSGLLSTHADWDHLLGRLAFPDAPLGCAESSARRIAAEPGAAQRELRAFDEELYLQRARPLVLGSVQSLPVPGRLDIAGRELELHPTAGHTADGMVIWAAWAGVLVAGDYLSALEIPMLSAGGGIEDYRATLERLRPLVSGAEHVVPGHGPVSDADSALQIMDEDLAYLRSLAERGGEAELPVGRRSREQRRIHERNVASLAA
jgi:glyoxylase-like metal-dependent hydrolase (beta-lactamase superfamily II)